MLKYLITLASVSSLLLVGFFVFPCRDQDRLAYQELLKSSNPIENDSVLSYSQQKRGDVKKRIWYQDDSPLHIRIDSPESELFFIRQNNKVELIEQLGHVKCIMQEELFYKEGKPMQKVRYVEAVRATYHYNTHLFVAEDVKLWKFQFPGHQPPEDIAGGIALMSATAECVEFTLKGKKLDFVAHKMRAVVNSKEREL